VSQEESEGGDVRTCLLLFP